MTRPQAVALGLAIVGVLISMSSGAFAAASPDLRDAIHSFGLVVMLTAAVVFLTAKRVKRMSGGGRRIHAPPGAAETAGNLAIAGAAFLTGAMAISLAFRWVLRSDMLVYWILMGLGVLGAGGMIAGAAGFAFIKLIGKPTSNRQENGP
jgi:hypothetical protein